MSRASSQHRWAQGLMIAILAVVCPRQILFWLSGVAGVEVPEAVLLWSDGLIGAVTVVIGSSHVVMQVARRPLLEILRLDWIAAHLSTNRLVKKTVRNCGTRNAISPATTLAWAPLIVPPNAIRRRRPPAALVRIFLVIEMAGFG